MNYSSTKIQGHQHPSPHPFVYFGVFFYKSNNVRIQFSSVAQSYPTLCNPMNRSTPGFPCPTPIPGVYPNMSIELVMPFNRLILCHPLLLLTSVFPSIKVFSNELPLHIRWLKDWSFSLSISASNEHPGLISLRMDQSKGLVVQGTLKSILQKMVEK